MATKEENHSRGMTISLLLRIATIVFMGLAGLMKFVGGLGNTVAYVQSLFDPIGFPHWISTTYGWAIPFIELVLAVWFIVGWRLKFAWFVFGLYMISLAFGMWIVGVMPVAFTNLFFIFYAIIGMRVSHADKAHA